MNRFFPALVAGLLLAAYGATEGVWTHRWSGSEDTAVAAARLENIPSVVGDWYSSSEQIDERLMVKAQLSGGILRHYTHKVNGAMLTVMLVCGPPGPVSVHTPDVCFAGSGAELTRQPEVINVVEDRRAAFYVGTFRQTTSGVVGHSRAFWGWTADVEWSAPASPRLAFARAPALYKLYIVRSLSGPDDPLDKDPARDFLRLFLPQLRGQLSPPA